MKNKAHDTWTTLSGCISPVGFSFSQQLLAARKKASCGWRPFKPMRNTQVGETPLKPKKKLYVIDKNTLKQMKNTYMGRWVSSQCFGRFHFWYTDGSLLAHFKFIFCTILGARALSTKRLLWYISVLAHFCFTYFTLSLLLAYFERTVGSTERALW